MTQFDRDCENDVAILATSRSLVDAVKNLSMVPTYRMYAHKGSNTRDSQSRSNLLLHFHSLFILNPENRI